jgi:small-conductance mechanosensitive channel
VGKVAELSSQDIGTTVGLRETAARLGCSTKTAYRYLVKGKLPGARKVDTPQGEAWQVPVAAIEQLRALTERKTGKQPQPTQAEVATLVQRVSDLETRLQTVSAIASERAQTIQTISNTLRALTVSTESQAAALTQTQAALETVQGELASVSKQLADERARKWWQRRKK